MDGDGTDDFVLSTPVLTNDALLLWDADNPTVLARTSPAGLLGTMIGINPSTTSDTLTSLRLGSTSYALPAGGGGTYGDNDVRDYLVDGLNGDNTNAFTLRSPNLSADRLLLWDANNVGVPIQHPCVRRASADDSNLGTARQHSPDSREQAARRHHAGMQR